MKLIISGCAGYIGATFTYEALKKGFKIVSSSPFTRLVKRKASIINVNIKRFILFDFMIILLFFYLIIQILIFFIFKR